MSDKPYIKNYFAGGNTAYGFYSLYDNILGDNGKRLIILKGGPGTGKSTIFKSIGALMYKKGYDVEYFYCSSDSNSLDGVAIPALKAAVVDGTAPHVIDPVIPGAYDEIINLGEYWNEKELIPYRDEIGFLGGIIKEYFTEAYRYLAEAKITLDHLKLHTSAIMDLTSIHAATDNLLEKLLGKESHRGKTSRERHLFASAITPEGLVNHYPSILSECRDLYFLTGDPGVGKSTLLEKVCQGFRQKGIGMEVYQCAFDPQKIDALVIPEKRLGLVKITDHHSFTLPVEQVLYNQITLGLGNFSSSKAYREKTVIRDEYSKSFSSLLGKAISSIKKAKLTHSKREQYYYKAMDFSKVDIAREKIVDKICSLI